MTSPTPTRPPLRRVVWLGLLLAALVVMGYALSGRAALGSAPVSDAAPASPTSASPVPASSSATGPSTAAPSRTDDASPSSTASATPPSPAVSATPSTADARVAALVGERPAPRDRIAAAPTHVDLHRGEEHYIGAEVQLTQKDGAGEINPTPRTVGWYGPPQWATTPGETSAYPGVLAGHVVHSGFKDVFWRLGEARLGDLVVLTYDDGTRAVFRVTRAAESVDKSALTHDPAYGWAWRLAAPDAVVTLITCDLVPGSGLTGASTANWVVQATRVA